MPKVSQNLSVGAWDFRYFGAKPYEGFVGSVSEKDVEYLCNSVYPFIQIINANAIFEQSLKANLINTDNGWIIFDYDSAMSASSSLYNSSPVSSNTSVIAQINTISKIGELISEKEWNKVELIDGTTQMKRLLWLESTRCGFKLLGYEPNEQDKRCLDVLQAKTKEAGVSWQKQIIKKPASQQDETVVAGAVS